MEKAQKYAEQLLNLARRLEESELLIAAYQACGVVNLQLGRLSVAKQHLVQGEALEIKKRSDPFPIEDGHRGKASILANLALTLWLLGYPDQALVKISESLAVVETMVHPFQLSIVLFFATLLYGHMHKATLIATPIARVLALDAQYHISISGPAGALAQGWLLAEQGNFAEGIAQMRAGIDGYKAFNHMMFQTHRLGLLIEAQLKAKQFDIAATTLAEAFALAEQSGQRSWDADLYRLKGDLLCVTNARDPEAVACYEQAIQIARQQSAKLLELRAAMSLARLWQSQGKSTEARALLEPVYNWFTEGFATVDLQAAQTLLAELTAATP
jgi:predicted negative regulator of RcsB-dependent stress response